VTFIGRAQTKKRRPVLPICDALLPWLRNLEPGFVIRWKQDQQEPIKRIQTAFDAARTRAKFSPAITPYSIRHTVAVELRKRGVPMAEVAGFLGHKNGAVRDDGDLRALCPGLQGCRRASD
jgi:integrase